MSNDDLVAWSKIGPLIDASPYFHLPPKNDLIATNFEVLPLTDQEVIRCLIVPTLNILLQVPELIQQTTQGNLWYCPIGDFKVPKANLYVCCASLAEIASGLSCSSAPPPVIQP